MAFGTLTSRVLGLFRDMAFAALFSRTVTDAWTTAFRLPNLFRRLLGEGSLSVSFIPVFVEARVQNPDQAEGLPSARVQNLINSFYTLLLLVLSTLTVAGIVWADPILKLLLDENYGAIPGKFELTVRMAQIMFTFIFLMSSYAYFMGILNALGKYALAAMAPALFNIAMIISTFIPLSWLKSPGDGLAWGVVVGGLFQTLILVPSLIRHNYLPKADLNIKRAWQNPDVRRVLKNMVPGLLGMGLLQITTIINLKFASSLGEGAISYIYWADRLLELPLSLVSVSLGTALLPTLSKMWSLQEKDKMSQTANYYLRLNLFISIPAAIGLYVLALPIIEVLFLRGRFSMEDALQTSKVVQVYSLILISTSCVRVFVPSFYAIKNTWFPAAVSVVSLISHLFFAPLLMKQWGLVGLSSSTFLSSFINLVLLMAGYFYFIGPFGLLTLSKSVIKFILSGIVLWVALLAYQPTLEFLGESVLTKIMALFFTIALAGISYFIVSYILKSEELTTTLETFLAKIKRKLKKQLPKNT